MTNVVFAGPMLGRHSGWVPNPAEVLGPLLAEDGYGVRLTSSRIGRAGRAADTVACLARWRSWADVVVVLVYSGPAFVMAELATAAARAGGRPVVHALHGGDLPSFVERYPRRVATLLASGRSTVVPSGYLGETVDKLAQARGIDLDVVVAPNVVRLERYAFTAHAPVAEPGPRVLWMRTFHELYRPDLAVRVLARVRRELPGARLTMAGQDRGELDAVIALAERLGVGHAVTFPGFVDHADKAALFAEHDVFLNTNRVDNQPVSVIEAMAFGLPVVATAVGGVPFLVEDEVDGLLVPSGDDRAMAAAVARVHHDPTLAARLAAAGRRRAERSSWAAVAPVWAHVLG